MLYLIPVRYLLMLWGANKFFRRILRPHSVPNNELLDLISRIPDDEMLVSKTFLLPNSFWIHLLPNKRGNGKDHRVLSLSGEGINTCGIVEVISCIF